MADQRITQLTALPKTSVAANDALPVADISASQTKKVTVKDLVDAGLDLVDASSIDLSKLDQESTTKLGNAAIGSGAIAAVNMADDSSVAVQGSEPTSDHFQGRGFFNTATGNLKIYDGGGYSQVVIPREGIAEGAVGSQQLDDGAVTTAKVSSLETAAFADGAITEAKLADASISTAKYQAASVDAAAIGADAVTTPKIQNNAVTYEKVQQVSGTDKLLGRVSAGAGSIEEIACTAAGRALLDDADAAAQRATLGLGTLATQNGTFSGTHSGDSSGTNTGDQTITLTGDITGSGTAEVPATISNNAVTTDKINDQSITYAKIQNVSASDKLLGRGSTGSGVVEEIPCTAAGRAVLAGADAATQRTALGLGDLSTLSTVTADQLGTQAVTAIKLANGSTVDLVTALPASGTFNGQFALNTTNNKLYCWNGSAWAEVKAAGSVNSIVSDNSGIVNTQITQSADEVTISTSFDNTTAAAQFLAGPTGAAGAVSYRTIDGADLPTAASNSKGGVVVNGNGLVMTGNTIAIDNTVTPEATNHHIVQYDANGLITGGRQIVAADVPVATAGSIGVVQPGSGLGVDAGGILNHSNSITAGTATKITFDAQGHVTATQALEADDIPELDASKITTGTFGSGFLAANSVTAEQLADYGIAQVSETAPTPEFAGQWWINPSDRSAYIWVGTVSPTPNGYWLLVGYGSPTQLNLRFGGTYDASTNTVVSLNEYGTEAGLTIGQALSAPNSQNNGVYLAVTTAGTGTTPAPAASLAVGDWVLSQGTGSNWTKVAVVSGASGTFNDYDILSDGTYFTPNMSGVADVRDALELLWGRVQIASTVTRGIVLESAEVLVDNTTGAMSIGVVDDGSY